MPGKKTPANPHFSSLLQVSEYFSDENVGRLYFEKARWGGRIICQKCGSDERIYRINDGKLFKCAKCQKQFTVRTGSIMEKSPLSFRTWFMAIFLVTAHKKGISSHQLARDLNITQKSAWHMLHRIRNGVKAKEFGRPPLTGRVEADETHIGGKFRNMHAKKRRIMKRLGWTANKTAVFGMIERATGTVRNWVVGEATSERIVPIIKANLANPATLITDSSPIYTPLKEDYFHRTVDHAAGQYTSCYGIYYTNSIEGYWSLFKRSIIGIYHHVSAKHLQRYADEMAFRFNTRKLSDIERFNYTLPLLTGALPYKELIK